MITQDGKDVKEVYTMTDAKERQNERQVVQELYDKLPPDMKAVFVAYINMNAAAMKMLLSMMEQTANETK